MHSKHLTWGNKKTFPETCQLGVFERIRHRNTEKNIKKHQILEKKQHYLKRVFWVFFFSFLRTKTLKRVQNTLYGKTEH